MNYALLIRIIAIVSLVIIVANLLLFAFNLYSALIFWGIIILIAIIAFPGLGWLRKRAVLAAKAQRKK